MSLRRIILFAVPTLLAAASPALAQFPGQEPPCMREFTPLRDDTEKKANAIRDASKKKVTPQVACTLFNALSAAEDKMVKFTAANVTSCGIPPQVVEQMKTSHARTLQIRAKVCQAAAAPAAAAPPSLGEALGTTPAPTPRNIKPGRGTYDTLTGTPLGSK